MAFKATDRTRPLPGIHRPAPGQSRAHRRRPARRARRRQPALDGPPARRRLRRPPSLGREAQRSTGIQHRVARMPGMGAVPADRVDEDGRERFGRDRREDLAGRWAEERDARLGEHAAVDREPVALTRGSPPWSTRSGICGPVLRFSSKSGFAEPERAVADR